jgi:hypothetical protein
MGGVEVSVKEIQWYVSQWAQRGSLQSGSLRLSVEGVLQLAKLGHFIQIPRSKIDDKSKADTLQKFLVMTQVIWMATQCIVRKAYGLPLSLLEVHTMVHVVCALVMYIFWIKKPKDLTDPEVIDSSKFDDIVALMVQEQFHHYRSDEMIFYPLLKSDRYRNGQEPQTAVKWIHDSDYRQRKYLQDEDDRYVGVEWVKPSNTIWSLKVGEVLPSGLGIVARGSSWEVHTFQRRVLPDWYRLGRNQEESDVPDHVWIREEVVTEPSLPTIDLQPADIVRWQRVILAVENLSGQIQKPELFHPDNRDHRYPDEHFHDGFNRSAGNFPYTGDSQSDPDQIMAFIFNSKILLALLLVLPAAYGGIHLIVSNFEFPSNAERLFWKIASINIIATMPAFFLLTFIGSRVSRLFFSYDSIGENAWAMVYKFPGHVLLFVYVVARSFLVVESFISLRAVPIGVYWTPSWLQMLPHV